MDLERMVNGENMHFLSYFIFHDSYSILCSSQSIGINFKTRNVNLHCKRWCIFFMHQ
jgi:hypothetical protein